MISEEYLIDTGCPSLIVSFGGYDQGVGCIRPFEFLRFLQKRFPNSDKYFVKDTYCSCYHKGIGGISTNINETKEYIQEKIKGYSKVLFLGISGGGYAAILFGSLLGVNYVLAFIPQTILRKDDKDPEYKNISKYINNVTVYKVYGDLSVKNPLDPHHISQCENIESFKNVEVIKRESLNFKRLRDSGELIDIISKFNLK